MANYGATGIIGEAYKPRSAMSLFPLAFTMICFLLFMIPMYLLLYMVHNPVVNYWIESYGNAMLLIIPTVIPVIILVVHCVHHMTAKPNKFAILVALLVPSILLIFFANLTMTQSLDYATMLFSVDCNTLREKAHLQASWEEASTLYANCIKETAAQRNLTLDYLADNFRVQDCTEYPDALKEKDREKTWNYLRLLEETQYCTGFCTSGHHLWAKTPAKDSCSVAISTLFRQLVHAHSAQVVLMMLMVLGFTFISMIFVGPVMREQGIEW